MKQIIHISLEVWEEEEKTTQLKNFLEDCFKPENNDYCSVGEFIRRKNIAISLPKISVE
jgi:hypothetical protein